MEIKKTDILDVKLIIPKVFNDTRGYFFEGFQKQRYQEAGLTNEIVQINHSYSVKNTLRGLHYQIQNPQDKLITVIRGKVWDVAVDVRKNSATFGHWVGFELSDENHHQLFIPRGFAHGFVVLSEEVDFLYACTDYYCPAGERGIRWDDPELAIPWPVANPILSAKDEVYPGLKDIAEHDLF